MSSKPPIPFSPRWWRVFWLILRERFNATGREAAKRRRAHRPPGRIRTAWRLSRTLSDQLLGRRKTHD